MDGRCGATEGGRKNGRDGARSGNLTDGTEERWIEQLTTTVTN